MAQRRRQVRSGDGIREAGADGLMLHMRLIVQGCWASGSEAVTQFVERAPTLCSLCHDARRRVVRLTSGARVHPVSIGGRLRVKCQPLQTPQAARQCLAFLCTRPPRSMGIKVQIGLISMTKLSSE